jgi:polyhydroxyalkanoate synthesis regulator protein
MANSDRPTIIEKYANRRLYNTVDQHLMMCIVDTVKMMLAVSSLEISSKG